MPLVEPSDLGVYLGQDIDNTDLRAVMLIGDAVTDALSILWPGDDTKTEADLPAGAAGVIRPAVARIYLNPAGVSQETVGPVNYLRSAATGSMFSKAEKRKLRRLNGGGGAFSIDLLPADAGDNLPWWDADAESSSSSSSSSSS